MIRKPLIASLLLLSSATGAGSGAAGPWPAAPPMVVTTDTDAYCTTLSRQIDQHRGALPEAVAQLRAQGLRLCADGQVRGGINRLRRALVVLDRPAGADEPDEDEGQ